MRQPQVTVRVSGLCSSADEAYIFAAKTVDASLRHMGVGYWHVVAPSISPEKDPKWCCCTRGGSIARTDTSFLTKRWGAETLLAVKCEDVDNVTVTLPLLCEVSGKQLSQKQIVLRDLAKPMTDTGFFVCRNHYSLWECEGLEGVGVASNVEKRKRAYSLASLQRANPYRLLSRMSRLGFPFGFAVHFGPKQLESLLDNFDIKHQRTNPYRRNLEGHLLGRTTTKSIRHFGQ